MLSLGLVIELIVAALLATTIGYCFVLNGRLKRLRADEEAFRATITDLFTATDVAERAIEGLRAAVVECDETLGATVRRAETQIGELTAQLEAGDAVVRRLGQIAAAARPPRPDAGTIGAAAGDAAARLAAYRAARVDGEAA